MTLREREPVPAVFGDNATEVPHLVGVTVAGNAQGMESGILVAAAVVLLAVAGWWTLRRIS